MAEGKNEAGAAEKKAKSSIMEKWKQVAKKLKREVYALYFAYRDPRVPWYAKVFIACLVAYAFSPIDPIPDFIPVLGYLDELVVIPLGVALAMKMMPGEVMEEAREKADLIQGKNKPKNLVSAAVIIAVWIALVVLTVKYLAAVF